MSIQRYCTYCDDPIRDNEGPFVLYADHVAALKDGTDWQDGYTTGRTMAIRDCIAAVEGLPPSKLMGMGNQLVDHYGVVVALRALLEDK